MESTDYVMVTDWDEVKADDFYLSDEWAKECPEAVEQARELQKVGKLYVGFIVSALSYCIYKKMDASQIFIDEDGSEILRCESSVIGNKHEHAEAYHM